MKKTFHVLENETVSECLERMAKEGYTPVRRIEKPVFIEVSKNGKREHQPAYQKILFEGVKKSKGEH